MSGCGGLPGAVDDDGAGALESWLESLFGQPVWEGVEEGVGI